MHYRKIASELDRAAIHSLSIPQISKVNTLSLQEAYAIQSISLAKRYERGERLVGIKLGFTSKAKMEQMGVHDLIWGKLTDQMEYPDGGILIKSDFIHPRAEPEIAFQLFRDIQGDLSLENVKSSVGFVAVALEIIDSRYEDFKFSLEDVIADNCSSAGYVIGRWKSAGTELFDIPMSLKINDKIIHQGSSNAILGNPWESMMAAARLAKENGEILRAGSIILAGAATPASFIEVGQVVTATAEGLGSVTLNIG